MQLNLQLKEKYTLGDKYNGYVRHFISRLWFVNEPFS